MTFPNSAEKGRQLRKLESAAGPRLRQGRRGQGWLVVALGVAAVVAAGSWLAASSLARGNADRSRRDFRASTARIASSLELALLHEEDLIASVSGLVVTNPDQSTRDFLRSTAAIHALQRYPELQ